MYCKYKSLLLIFLFRALICIASLFDCEEVSGLGSGVRFSCCGVAEGSMDKEGPSPPAPRGGVLVSSLASATFSIEL